jgi:hypothetical protein
MNIMKLFYRIVPVMIILTFLPHAGKNAQSENELILSLSRDFGYSSGTGKIQGTFSMKVKGPENLTLVVFLIDGEEMGEVTEEPFRLQFKTGDYPLGIHTLSAVGYTSDGKELHSNEKRAEFVTSEEGWSSAGKIVIIIFGLMAAVGGVSYLITYIMGRGKKSSLSPGAPRNYGLIGGTICPKCERPFGMHIWGLNLGMGKFDRCPHCSRWSIVRRVSRDMLSAAEAAELKAEEEPKTPLDVSDEEKLRKELEDSKFEDV